MKTIQRIGGRGGSWKRFRGVVAVLCGLASGAAAQTPPIPLYHLPFGGQPLTNWGQAEGVATASSLNATATVHVVEDATLKGFCAVLPMNAGGQQGPLLVLPNSATALRLTGAGDALTISAWVKWNGPNGHPNPQQYLASCLPSSLNQGWGFAVCKDGTLSFSWYRAAGGGGSRNSTATVPVGQWTHVAVTWRNDSGSGLAFYINGTPAGFSGSPVGTGPLLASAHPIYLGASSANFYLPLNGSLADVQLFGQALAPTDIARIAGFKATGERYVFVHYMVCFPPGGAGATVADFEEEILQAQARGIDGFALNCGGWTVRYPSYKATVLLIYQAAQALGTDFKLFISADFSGSPTNAEVTDMVESFRNHPNQLHYQGKPVLSTFGGGGTGGLTTFIRSQFSGTDPTTAGGPIIFIPFLYPSPATEGPTPAQIQQVYDANAAADGFFYFGAAGSPSLITGYVAQMSAIWHAGGKLFMAPVTPYYRGLGGNYRVFETDGFQGMLSEWQAATQYADWAEIVTWNDWGESSYVAPYGPAGQTTLPGGAYPAEGNLLNHSAYLDASAYYINWFKLGHPLVIEEDQVYYFHRLAPKTVLGFPNPPYTASSAPTAAPSGVTNLSDQVYVTAFLAAPAQLTVNVGATTASFNLAAGVSSVSVPMATGTPQVVLQRGGVTVISKTGEQGIAPGNTWSNFQYFSGSADPALYADPPVFHVGP